MSCICTGRSQEDVRYGTAEVHKETMHQGKIQEVDAHDMCITR